MPAKRKIYIALVLWLTLCASMPLYFFKILENSNSGILEKIASEKKDLAFYKVEAESFQLAQKDLDAMKGQARQPENLFSGDITFVNEIKVMENLGQRLNINLALSGISGTVKKATKANTAGDIVVIPYGIAVTGPFPKVVDFVEILENLDFITTISSVSISSAAGGEVNANFFANFYLKRS